MTVLLLLIAIVLFWLLRRVLVTIRLKGKIKWIAGGYVVVLIVIAIIVSCKTPTLRDATEAQLRQAAAQQADLRKGKISLYVSAGGDDPSVTRSACQLPLIRGAKGGGDDPSVTAAPCQLPLIRGAKGGGDDPSVTRSACQLPLRRGAKDGGDDPSVTARGRKTP